MDRIYLPWFPPCQIACLNFSASEVAAPLSRPPLGGRIITPLRRAGVKVIRPLSCDARPECAKAIVLQFLDAFGIIEWHFAVTGWRVDCAAASAGVNPSNHSQTLAPLKCVPDGLFMCVVPRYSISAQRFNTQELVPAWRLTAANLCYPQGKPKF